jgi:hypothetical protein
MPEILSKVARSYFHFWPSSIVEVAALYMAKTLDDEANVRGYVSIVNCYPNWMIKNALQRLVTNLPEQGSRLTLLRDELLTLASQREAYD